ncbi:hypothetical protein CMQ_1953 [Grosmannia clavigera kw1407]|uniref:SnoaL-like domain-containing protein n=1 Tax=Grosmannia clavigera (strain kw1407 / UAMH 11150) TaxID=655863 RepID=F0XMV8_GROCL|nr:uncharacterized protein CMQ_1953 [Grosmannia clavigera kw1407]EFX00872.1 hypothetical protein CMQ_1953 [Grosmannia clavigera kw1407]
MPTAAEVQTDTLQRFIDAWKRWNAKETISFFAESTDFRQVTMPFQMNVPERTRAEVEQTLPYVVRAVRKYNLRIHRVIHDRQKGEAAIYAVSKGDTPFGPWSMEYATFLTFSESGDRITRIEEMLDSNHAQWFGPQLQGWIRGQTGTDVDQ